MEYWDATRISALKACPEKLRLRYDLGWRPKRPNIHLAWGGAFARALELWHKEDLEAGVRHCMAVDLPEHAHKTRQALVNALVTYADTYDDQVHMCDGKPAVELHFAVPVADDITLCGHLDKVISVHNRLFVVDQKTTSSKLSDYYFNQFSTTEQIFMYSWAAKVVLDSPISGIIIDAVRVAPTGIELRRQPVIIPQACLDEWVEDTVDLIRKRPTGHNFTSCWKMGGCSFTQVCKSSPGIRQKYLDADFVQGPAWVPEVPR